MYKVHNLNISSSGVFICADDCKQSTAVNYATGSGQTAFSNPCLNNTHVVELFQDSEHLNETIRSG